jgi:ditrans,polycis-polyprenyl diphosphate synthase
VKVVTVYAFSLENFKRPKEQVDQIMTLSKYQLAKFCEPGGLADRHQAAIRVVGQLGLLDDDVRETFLKAVEITRHRKERFFNVCMAYTSREEMAHAVRVAAKGCCQKEISPSTITVQSLTAQMYISEDPPVDIMVRTSGVNRFSDFLLWQGHQDTDIQIMDVLWPDFGMYHLFLVIIRWQRRMHAADIQNLTNGFLLAPFIFALMSMPLACFLLWNVFH